MKLEGILTKLIIIVLAVCCVCMMYLLSKQSASPPDVPETTGIAAEITTEPTPEYTIADNLNRVDPDAASYIVNTNTQKFHRTDCSEIQKIKPENFAPVAIDSEKLEQLGYTGCKKCNPVS